MLTTPAPIANSTEAYRPIGFVQSLTAVMLCPIILGTIFGNSLVIISVITYQRLQTFTNMLLVSLATSDLLVGLLVMPFAFLYLIEERWRFGSIYCYVWATFDVLLCTASILNLCAISIDRYCAISYPLRYIRRRTDCLAAGVVATVWGMSIIICAPPWFNIPGWSFIPAENECQYVSALSYRIYSACGSFFIPLAIMVTVYWRIFKVSTSREKALNVGLRSGSRFFKMHRGKPKTSTAALHSSAALISGLVDRGQSPRTPINRRVDFGGIDRGRRVEPDRGRRGDSDRSRSDRSRSDINTIVISQENSVCSIAESDVDIHSAASPCPEKRKNKTVGYLAQTARTYYERSLPTSLLSKANEYYVHSKPVKPSKEKSVYLKERKALKTIGLVVAGFVICWFPFFVIYILESACVICGIPQVVGNFFLWLGYSNSVLNPVIYAAYNRDFRRCFRDILTCGCCKKRTRKTMSVRRLHQSMV